MKLRNARVGAMVGTYDFYKKKDEYCMTHGQILEVLPDAIVVKWDDIAGEVIHYEPDLHIMFLIKGRLF